MKPTIKLNLKKRLMALRPEIAAVAQKIYDEWNQDELFYAEGYGVGGGICGDIAEGAADLISEEFIGKVGNDRGQPHSGKFIHDKEIEVELNIIMPYQHYFLVIELGNECCIVDIPCNKYEKWHRIVPGAGYYAKTKNVTFHPKDVMIKEIDINEFNEYGDHIGEPDEHYYFEKMIGKNKKHKNPSNPDHVDLTISYILLHFKVRIHKDGRLEFTDPPIDNNYAILSVSLGEDEYQFEVKLLDEWEVAPMNVIEQNFRGELVCQLASDYCERVLPIYKKHFPKDENPGLILEFLREYAICCVSDRKWRLARERADRMQQNRFKVDVKVYQAMSAFWHATHMHYLDSDEESFERSTLADVADFAQAATQDPEEERAWQIRRFVDVTNAWKGHQDIPGIKETP